VDSGFIASDHLQQALAAQKKSQRPLGEILRDMGLLQSDDIHAALSVQKALGSTESILEMAAGPREHIGEILLAAKRITREQLDLALQEQQQSHEKLGEIFIRHGWLTAAELDAMLAFQERQGSNAGKEGPLRLGSLLVAAGHLTSEQLAEAIVRQRSSNKRLGDVLIELGYAKPDTIAKGLSLQRRLLCAALAALLALSPVIGMDSAYAAGDASSRVAVSARVQTYVKLEKLEQVQQLTITQADIDRGYVEVADASRLAIRSNSEHGYVLVFDAMADIFTSTRVQGLQGDFELGAAGGAIMQRQATARVPIELQLGYRFQLARHVQPGTYSWPMAVSIMPL
jgi:hypothetical protein